MFYAKPLRDANIFSLLILVVPLVEPIFEAVFLRTDGWDKLTQSTDVQHSVSWMDEEYMLSFYGGLGFFYFPFGFPSIPGFVPIYNVVGWSWPAAKLPPSHFLSLLSGTEEKIGRTGARKLVGQDEDRRIAHHLLSWARQTHLGEFPIKCQLIDNI